MHHRDSEEPLAATLISDPVGGVTLQEEPGLGATANREGDPPRSDRYRTAAVLGVGGMGEVALCRDGIIGRDVALKRMRGDVRTRAHAYTRFVREALVQARLEHPSIVPVYDVALSDAEGPWFTMKRIRGRSLESVLREASAGASGETPSRRRLLTAFVQVCRAVDYAHQRGVVHRDLKPENVMLGEFGEVHLLDWGLAKIVGETPTEQALDLGSSDEGATLAGSLMGTPGYMAPEQARGAVDEIGPRTDVYALGAILFEILTLERLHRGDTAISVLTATIAGVDATRFDRPDLAPELAELCARATATATGDRRATARELADAVERFLDGDRDVQLRAQLAGEHFERAQRHLAGDGALTESARAAALRELGRPGARGPRPAAARAVVAPLRVQPTETLPPELEPELARARDEERRAAFGSASRRFLFWTAFIFGMIAMGIRHLPLVLTISGCIIASSAFAAYAARAERPRTWHGAILLATSTIVITLSAGVLGPFVVAPGLAATNTVFFGMHAAPRHRPWVVVVGVLAVLLPFVLDVTGVTPAAWVYGAEGVTIRARMLELPELATNVSVLLASTLVVIVPTVMVSRTRDALVHAERRQMLQAWRLRQMLPRDARDLLGGPGSAR